VTKDISTPPFISSRQNRPTTSTAWGAPLVSCPGTDKLFFVVSYAGFPLYLGIKRLRNHRARQANVKRQKNYLKKHKPYVLGLRPPGTIRNAPSLPSQLAGSGGRANPYLAEGQRLVAARLTGPIKGRKSSPTSRLTPPIMKSSRLVLYHLPPGAPTLHSAETSAPPARRDRRSSFT